MAATTTLSNSVTYTKGAYTAFLSPWGAGSLVQGKDYADTATLNPDLFPNGVTITWTWPEQPPKYSGVYNFDAITFGNYNYALTNTVAASQIKAIGSLTETFSLSTTGDGAKYDVITDFFLTAKANDFSTKLFEVEVALHTPTYAKNWMQTLTALGTYTDAQGRAWTAVMDKVGAVAPNILLMPKGGGDLLSGSVDVKGMLDWLTGLKVLSGNEYFNGLSLGTEVRQGSGSLAIKNFQVDYALAHNDAAPVIDSNGGGASAALSVASGTAAVATVHATDADGTAPTYAITGGADASLFTLDARTGALAFKAAPSSTAPKDAGGDNVYNVTVQASDGLHTDTQALAVTVKAAPLPASTGPTTYAVTNEAYDAQWHLSALTRQSETVGLSGTKQVVQQYGPDGTLTGIVQTSTVGTKDTIQSFDAAWKLLGTDVITHGTQTTTEHYTPAAQLTGRDVFSVSGATATEQHFDARGTLTGTDVATAAGNRDRLDHYDAQGTTTGYDLVYAAGGKYAVHHYDAAGAFQGAEATTLSALQAANHDPMTGWLIG